MESRIKNLIDFCRQDGRVCPRPNEWNELYNLLPDKRPKGGGMEPAVPLILAAWTESPILLKWLRVEEHIRWAAEHGALDRVEAFLRGLPDDKWYRGK